MLPRPQGDREGDHRLQQRAIIQNKSQANLLSLRLGTGAFQSEVSAIFLFFFTFKHPCSVDIKVNNFSINSNFSLYSLANKYLSTTLTIALNQAHTQASANCLTIEAIFIVTATLSSTVKRRRKGLCAFVVGVKVQCYLELTATLSSERALMHL